MKMSRKSWFLLGVGAGHLFLFGVGIEMWGGADQVFSELVISTIRGGGLVAGLFFFWSLLKFRRFRVEQVVLATVAAIASLFLIQHHSVNCLPGETHQTTILEAQSGPSPGKAAGSISPKVLEK